MVSFAVATAVGAIFLFPETVAFFGGLSGGDTRTASPLYVGNQSLLGVFFRLGDTSRTTTLIGLAVAGLVALLGAAVGSYWWRHGHRVFAVAIVGLCTNLASPLSWTHHYVWILPMAVALLPASSVPPRRGATVAIPRWAHRAGHLLGALGLPLPAARPAALRRREGASATGCCSRSWPTSGR